jgi:hypothetical protein
MIIALRHLFLYYSWQLCYSCASLLGVPLPLFLYSSGEVTRKVTESVTIWSQSELYLYLSILHIFSIDIIIYILKSMLWSSKIFCMVGQVIANPSLSLPSLCGVVAGYQSSSGATSQRSCRLLGACLSSASSPHEAYQSSDHLCH